MRVMLTTLILAAALSAAFAVICMAHEPRQSLTREHVHARIYGWPHEWLAVTDDGRREVMLRRLAFSFGLVVVLPTAVLVTISAGLAKPGKKK